MNNNLPQPTTYRSLTELQLRKEQLRNALHKDNDELVSKWRSLFKPQPDKQKKRFTMSSIVNTGASAIDGFMLAWKLYKKFHK